MRASVRLGSLVVLAACARPAMAPPAPATRATSPPAFRRPPAILDAAPDIELVRTFAETRNFHLGVPEQATLTPDLRSVLFLRSPPRDPTQSLFEMDLGTGATRALVSPGALLAGPETISPEERVRRERMRVRATGFTSLEVSLDGAKALVTLSGRAFVVDRATGKALALSTGEGAVVDPHFSPDAARVAYVRDDDVHVVPIAGGPDVQVTRGGNARVTHGLAEFVAEEELDRTRGFWWSPDASHILYEEADTTRVDVLSIADPFRPDEAPQRIAYPRPGRPNADVRFGIAGARAASATTWVQWDRARFPYVARALWPDGGPPLLCVLDRLQRSAQLLAVSPASGKTTALTEEHDDAWLNVDPTVPRWLADGSGFLWSSERSGEPQLELRDPAGKLVRELLPKGFGYRGLAGVDGKKRTAVVVASDDPTRSLLWRVSLDGSSAPVRLGREGEVVTAHFGKSHDAYVAVESSLGSLPRTVVRSMDGAMEREVPSAAEAPRDLPAVEIIEVGPDRMRTAIVRPRGFRDDRRYAVIDAAYAGPHVTVVERSALSFLRAQWIADATGAVVVAVDARGTPRRGRDWERALRGRLGTVPLEGHVGALQALGSIHPELDLSRVGVYGWSFGGYFAALAVLVRPDFYKVAVAGAPPADWRDYDTAYTERYLGLPAEEPAAYDAASLLTYARRPPASPDLARPLLIVHGTADDNVWFLNAAKLADALERGGRTFDFLPLAGTTHMLLDPSLSEAVWLRTAAFLRNALR